MFNLTLQVLFFCFSLDASRHEMGERKENGNIADLISII